MPDYGNGKIYSIRCRTDDTLIYVGSTIQSLAVRWGGHKRHSKVESHKNSLIYRTINQDWDNWFIELYELYPCSSKEELCRREGEIIREIGTLNVRVEGQTKTEYMKIFYLENKDKYSENSKKWREENKERNKENGRIFEEKNKEKRIQQKKERYEKNRDNLREKITCECGCIVCRAQIKIHQKSKKHFDLMEQPTN